MAFAAQERPPGLPLFGALSILSTWCILEFRRLLCSSFVYCKDLGYGRNLPFVMYVGYFSIFDYSFVELPRF